MKECKTCKITQYITAFSKHSKYYDRLQPYCKSCANERSRKHYFQKKYNKFNTQ